VWNPRDLKPFPNCSNWKPSSACASRKGSFGDFDGFVILEAPDEGTVTAFILAALAPGHIRATRTTILMRPEALLESLKKAGTATFKGPGK
jgi:hypothetical protein